MAKLYTITLNGVTEDTYNQATDYIQKNALRLNYRPVASTIDVEFPDDIDPAKAPELTGAVIREVHQTLYFFDFYFCKITKQKSVDALTHRRTFFVVPANLRTLFA